MPIFAPIMIVPWLLALVLTPLFIALAKRRGWLDQPDERKLHTNAVPIVGGLSVFISIIVGLAIVAVFMEPVRVLLWGPGSLVAMGVCVVAIVGVGLYDDFRDLSPWLKIAAQVAIGCLAWGLGFRIEALQLPFGWMIYSEGIISLLMSVAWIVVVTNAFNLIDGMDGLASGVSIIIALTVFLLAHGNGESVPVVAALALSGALAGFLRFNLPPARIFLGDAGSMGIGFTTAMLSLASYQKSPAAMAMIVPLLILGLPLIDTFHSAGRRAVSHLRSGSAKRPSILAVARAMFRPDRGHVHHLLLRSGFSVQQVLVALYVLSAGLSMLALWTRSISSNFRWALFLGLMAAGYGGLQLLERRALRLEAEAALLERSDVPDAPKGSPAQEQQRATG